MEAAAPLRWMFGFLRHVLRRPLGLDWIVGMIAEPGETELGSAGTQPSKG